MQLDKNKLKEKLEKERDSLVDGLKDMGKLNPETNEWEATPEEIGYVETDQNDMADRFEDFEAKSSMTKVLQTKLANVLKALKGIGKESFGKCDICKKDIELARLEANPSARTCKKHINSN
ncbi:MAG TPA: TraR/DksA C4-type zinc finger protein [Candidatus Paceibacterota bacterium]|nr:TraR/DksA C4-type zinc finger protein [Candidatus Paceibacterota bacterium]HPT18037.1 TraR/DksA C4-type zinc finger protein [Candidatus Paceibacterota bacterium]